MNYNQTVNRLVRIELTSKEADARRIVMQERCVLMATFQRQGDLASAIVEANRVADMWT